MTVDQITKKNWSFDEIATHHTQEELHDFTAWFYGQTGPIEGGELKVYGHDYLRWLKQGKKKQQNYEDWD